MAINGSFTVGWAPRVLSILRIIQGFLLIPHGSQKLFGWPPMAMPGAGGPMPGYIYFAGVLEFVGGVLLLFGLFTRPVAFLISGMMAVAYFMAHAPRGFLPLVNQGELAVIYCFVCFYLAFAGGGPWSLDSIIRRKSV
jgi:putative oxidoreductase